MRLSLFYWVRRYNTALASGVHKEPHKQTMLIEIIIPFACVVVVPYIVERLTTPQERKPFPEDLQKEYESW